MEASATSQVKTRLDTQVRVELSDSRVLVGRFACLDKQRNILLVDVCEFRGASAGLRQQSERSLGIVLVPRRWVVACHAMEV